MVEKIKNSLKKDPWNIYKAVMIGSLPVFLAFILDSSLTTTSNTAAMKVVLENQQKIATEHRQLFKEYVDKTEVKLTATEGCINDLKEVDIAHDFILKDHDKRIQKLEDKG